MDPAVATKRVCTLADYMALDEPDGPRFELSEGELIMSPSPTWDHNKIRDRLNSRLVLRVEDRGMGYVTSETDFLLGPATVRRPDVAVVLAENWKAEWCRQIPVPAAPDIAIEIVSDSDRARALLNKVRQYLDAGTQSVWLFYPDQRGAHCYRANAAAPDIRTMADSWTEPELLSGVSFPLSEIFVGPPA